MRLPQVLLFVGLLGLALPATARERPKRRVARTTVSGTIKAPALETRPSARARSAYWSFGLEDLQERRPPLDYTEILVFLDLWDDAMLTTRTTLPDWALEGAALSPRCFVVPRRTAAEAITFHNRDRFAHALRSKDLPLVDKVALEPGAKTTVNLDVLPLEPGKFLRYPVTSRELGTVRGELLFLRSTAFAFADAKGAFELKEVPEGEHTLSVYYRGKVVLTKRITVGRQKLDAGLLTIDKAPAAAPRP